MPIPFRHFYRMVFFFVLALVTGREAIAQSPNFPVRASVTIVNPSPYLEDYGRDGNLLVVLTLVDNQPNYQGLLRVTIEGNGYRAETRDLLAQAPISLNFGAPVILRGPDLAAYFDLNNLNVEGIVTDNTVGNGGALPDGPISVCVEVYDVNRFTDPPVSNPACAIRFVQQNYPPELVRPLGQVSLPMTQTSPVQGFGREGSLAPSVSVLNFTWNPRHVPQPADDEYVLEVWKKIPGLTNDQIIRSSGRSRQPIITRLPRYTYTNYDSRLEVGAEYIWRVQVRDRRGVRQFINDGYSTPGEFTYGTIPEEELECLGAEALFAANVTDTEATISWVNPSATTSTGYQIRYRPVGQGSWTDAGSASITATAFALAGLEPETDYEVEVCANCKSGVPECASIPFATMEPELIDCGPMPDPSTFAITNNSLRVAWDNIPQAAGYVLTWKKLPNPNDPVEAQQQSVRTATDGDEPGGGGTGNTGPPPANNNRIELPAGATEAVTNSNLQAGYTYRLELCKICLDGREECFEWEVPFNGYVDYCSEDVQPNVAVVSGSESQNNMDLGWTYSGMNVLPEGYDLRLVHHPTADASAPDTTNLAGTMTGTTVTGLSVGADYTFELCVVCPDGEERCATATGTTDPFSCPEPVELEAAVIVTPVIPDGIMVDWFELGPATDPAGWSFALLNMAGDTLQKMVAETGYQTTFTGLDAETEYRVAICHQCPVADQPQCTEKTIFLPGCEAAELALTEGTVHFDFVELNWADVGAETYSVTFAEQGGEPLAEPQTTENTEFRLGGLSPTTTYDISVCFECGAEPICDTITLTTIGVNCALAGDYEYDFECGINVSLQDPENQQLVETLNPGDSIWAGDFLVEIAEITGNTTFGGFGRTKIPYLKNAKLRLDFHEIQVNEDCRMVAGKMVIKSPLEAALEQLQQGLQDLQDILGEIDDFLGSISNTLGTISTVLDQIATAADVTDEANAVLEQLVTALDQVPYLPDSYVDAVEDAADCLKQAAISGDDEAVRNCRDQLQEAIQNAQDYIDDLFDADFIVDFSPTVPATSYWGLDSQRYDLVTEGYDQRTIGGTPYKVPWASTSTEEPAGVPFGAVRRDNGTMQPVNFIGSDTEPYPGWTKDGTSASHPGLAAAGDQEVKVVFAAHDNPDAEEGNDSIPPVKLAGQLNLVTYTPVRHTVHIVPINNAALAQDAGQVEEALNRIYRPAVAEWSVVVEPNINVDGFAGTLQDIPNSLLSNYTPQMNSLKDAVKGQSYYDGDHYYLLVVPRMAEPDRLGFMPRKRAFGFLTAEQLTGGALFNRTVAHELGHGAFHLQHIFDRFDGLAAGSTDNLMDSGGGETLFKYQWDNVHDPESNFTLFDEEEEGESVAGLPCRARSHNGNGHGYYLTPASVFLKVLENQRVDFYDDDSEIPSVLRGRLKSIQIENDVYHAKYAFQGGLGVDMLNTFQGYEKSGSPGEFYNFGDESSGITNYFTGIKGLNASGNCACIFFERNTPIAGGAKVSTKDGDSDDGNFTANPPVPTQPSQWINLNASQIIAGIFCGLGDESTIEESDIAGAELLGSKAGSKEAVEGFLNAVTSPSLENTTKGCFYYYDQVNNTLQLYKSGSNQVLEYQESEIQSTLDNACSLAEDECEGVVVIIQRVAESNFKISSCYSDEFLTTGQAYQQLDGHVPYSKDDARTQVNGILKDKLESMGSLSELAQNDHTNSGGEDGSLIVKDAGFFVWVGAAADELGHILKNIEVDTNTWDPAAADYDGKILVIWAPVAGVGDQLMMEAKDMKDMIGAAGEFIKKPKETVTGIYTTVTSLSADDVVKMVSDAAKAEIQTLTTPGPKRQHRVGELSTQAASTIFNWTKGVGKAGLELTQELGQNSDAMMPFLRRMDLDMGERFRKLSPERKKMFKDDFEGLPDADLQKFIDNPDLIDGWEEMADFNFPSNGKIGHDIRLDLDFLEKYAALDAPRKTKMKDYLGNQVAAAGKKGHINYEITKNMDIGDGVLRDYKITYDKHGFPKFESLCKELTDNAGNQRRVMFEAGDLVGTVGDDLQRATTWAKDNFPAGSVKKISSTKISVKINGEWVPHTWHHHQNGKGLMAIPSKVHNVGQGGFGHSGGNALLGDPPIRDFFPDPDFTNL